MSLMDALTRQVPHGAASHHAVHVVDDDDAVRRSLALLLVSFGYVAETYDSAEAFLASLPRTSSGCVIVDIRMSGMDGLELQEELRRRGSTMPLIVVTGHGDVALAVRAMKAGAVDFVEKPYSDAHLMDAIAGAMTRLDDDRHRELYAAAARARIATLTPRECEVLGLLIAGRANKAIGHDLGISARTVEIHRAHMMDKLQARSLAEAVRVALAAGFPQP